MREKNAFTLIELLVGMGIVSVLVGMSLLGISIVQQSTRNTQRNDILNAINIAINANYVNTNVYPNLTYEVGVNEDYIKVGDSNSGKIKLTSPLRKGNTPTSPSTGGTTNYCYATDGAQYWLGVQLEDGNWKYITNSSISANPTQCPDSSL